MPGSISYGSENQEGGEDAIVLGRIKTVQQAMEDAPSSAYNFTYNHALWQNRFYSCPLEPTHWNAIAYVERNPVQAGLVRRAEDFGWSRAAAHLGGRDTLRGLDMDFWRGAGGASFWAELVSQEEPEGRRRDLRRATFAGKPVGSEEFLDLGQTQFSKWRSQSVEALA